MRRDTKMATKTSLVEEITTEGMAITEAEAKVEEEVIRRMSLRLRNKKSNQSQ